MGFPSAGSGGSSSPGFEIGYDQVTAPVTVASTTEATGTTLITCAAHVFDGSAVLVTFCCEMVQFGSQLNNPIVWSLFEGATQITELGQAISPTGAGTAAAVPVASLFRFTPTAASHTYTVTVFAGSVAGTAPVFQAGAGGVGARPPMFVRFTKV